MILAELDRCVGIIDEV